MKDVVSQMCKVCNEKQPVFGFKNKKATHCSSCQLDNMINVKNHKCSSCQLFIVSRKGGLCVYCKPSASARMKTKEMKVVDFIKANDIDFIHNKSIGFVCGNYRPDIKIDCGTHFLIIEIDEDQHRQYDDKCELSRVLNIHQALGMRCVFLRYNPDVFRVQNKATIVQTNTRLKLLLQETRRHMEEIPEEEVSIYKLFYNNDSGERVVRYNFSTEDLFEKVEEEEESKEESKVEEEEESKEESKVEEEEESKEE